MSQYNFKGASQNIQSLQLCLLWNMKKHSNLEAEVTQILRQKFQLKCK